MNKQVVTSDEGLNPLDGIGMDPTQYRNALHRMHEWMSRIYFNQNCRPVSRVLILKAAAMSSSPGGRAHNLKPSTISASLSYGVKYGLWTTDGMGFYTPTKKPSPEMFIYRR